MKLQNLYFSTESALEAVIRVGWLRTPQTSDRIYHPENFTEMVMVSNGDVDGHPTWKWEVR